MRRTFGLAALTGFAVLAFAQTTGSSLLANFGKALFEAKTVRSSYTIQTVGSTSEAYSVALKKPNLARVETPTQIVVADGKVLTTYTKAENTFFKRPQTDADMKVLLGPDDVSIFSGFYDANAYQGPKAKALGQRSINGSSLNLVSASIPHKVTTYFLDTTDNVARKSEIDVDSNSGKVTRILNTSSVEINADLPASTFTFDPPTDARELTADEVSAGRWYTDLDEALKVARASNKKVFIDFMATWCGPCKMLDEACFHTDTFKKLGRKFVFCRIDVDQQPSLASKFHADAIPLQVITDASGNQLDQMVGYGGPDEFFKFMSRNAG